MSDEQVRVEGDNPKNVIITASIVIVSVVLVVMVIGVNEWFGFAVRDEVTSKQLATEPADKRALRAQEAAHLSSYQYVDREKGIVRIPVERARELVVQDWGKVAEAPAAAAETVAAPADGTATAIDAAVPADAPKADDKKADEAKVDAGAAAEMKADEKKADDKKAPAEH